MGLTSPTPHRYVLAVWAYSYGKAGVVHFPLVVFKLVDLLHDPWHPLGRHVPYLHPLLINTSGDDSPPPFSNGEVGNALLVGVPLPLHFAFLDVDYGNLA